jgi:hypothetical protein
MMGSPGTATPGPFDCTKTLADDTLQLVGRGRGFAIRKWSDKDGQHHLPVSSARIAVQFFTKFAVE